LRCLPSLGHEADRTQHTTSVVREMSACSLLAMKQTEPTSQIQLLGRCLPTLGHEADITQHTTSVVREMSAHHNSSVFDQYNNLNKFK